MSGAYLLRIKYSKDKSRKFQNYLVQLNFRDLPNDGDNLVRFCGGRVVELKYYRATERTCDMRSFAAKWALDFKCSGDTVQGGKHKSTLSTNGVLETQTGS